MVIPVEAVPNVQRQADPDQILITLLLPEVIDVLSQAHHLVVLAPMQLILPLIWRVLTSTTVPHLPDFQTIHRLLQTDTLNQLLDPVLDPAVLNIHHRLTVLNIHHLIRAAGVRDLRAKDRATMINDQVPTIDILHRRVDDQVPDLRSSPQKKTTGVLGKLTVAMKTVVNFRLQEAAGLVIVLEETADLEAILHHVLKTKQIQERQFTVLGQIINDLVDRRGILQVATDPDQVEMYPEAVPLNWMILMANLVELTLVKPDLPILEIVPAPLYLKDRTVQTDLLLLLVLILPLLLVADPLEVEMWGILVTNLIM